MGEIGQALEEGDGVCGFRIEAGLGFFGAEFDFDEDGKEFVEFCGRFVDAFGEAEGVDRVDGVEELDGALGLVGLEMADEMGADGTGATCAAPASRRPGVASGARVTFAALADGRTAPADAPADAVRLLAPLMVWF